MPNEPHIILPAERRLHKETHVHRCPIHARGLCKHVQAWQSCDNCLREETNEICGKTLRGTGLDYHDFPCLPCQSHWRANYGGELLVDVLITKEQAERHKEVVKDQKVEDREDADAPHIARSK